MEITATVINNGGPTTSQFKVAFFAGDSEDPFDVKAIVGIEGGESVPVTVNWEVEDVDRVRVEVDYGNVLVEVNDNDNTAEHDINIAYGQYLGWLDSLVSNHSHGFSPSLPSSFSSVLQPLPAELPSTLVMAPLAKMKKWIGKTTMMMTTTMMTTMKRTMTESH